MTPDARPPQETREDTSEPHRQGRFGAYGGRFVPEALVAARSSSDATKVATAAAALKAVQAGR